MTRLTISLGLLMIAAVLTGGCDPGATTECDPGCEDGLVCNSRAARCEVPRLQEIEGEPSGRSVRLEVNDQRAFLASIDPQAGNVLVGSAEGEAPRMHLLSKITRPLSRKLAMASSSSLVALAWLEQDRKYRVAIHHLGDEVDRWRVLPALDTADDYRGSEHFDVAVDNSGRLRLAFHDAASGALRSLSGAIDDSRWRASVIDDPTDQAETGVCSEQQRRLSGQGLGFQPDITLRGGATFIAYHDGDCGDLRLASRVDEQWTVTVIDTGDFDDEDLSSLRRGVTGKHASISVDSSDNLAIAYQDVSRGQLLFAYDREGQFSIEVADAGFEIDAQSRRRKHLVGAFASLVFDDEDIPWIAYIDATTTRLRLAHRTSPLDLDGNWAQQGAGEHAPAGFSASLGFSPALGRLIAAEYLRPRPDGLESHLDLLYEEEL